MTAAKQTIIITPNQPVVSVGGRLVSLNGAPTKQGNRWLLPLDFLPRALGPALQTRIDLRRPSRLLIVGDLRVPRVVARVEPSPTGTTVVIDATPATPSRLTLEAGRLIVLFEADALDFAPPAVPGQDFLQGIQLGDVPAAIRLVTGPKFGVHRATTRNPQRTPHASRSRCCRRQPRLLHRRQPPLQRATPPVAVPALPIPVTAQGYARSSSTLATAATTLAYAALAERWKRTSRWRSLVG